MNKKLIINALLVFVAMTGQAQSIEVKYSVYSKKRVEAINKIKGAKENQGYQGLLSGMTAEKKDSFCLVVKGRMSSFEQIEPEEDEGITLTPEEKQVLTLSAQGYTMKEISDHICRSFDTVKFYRRQLFEKLDVANITEAIAFATNYGLL